ncbi:hypothetical protein [Nonomuraea endophytica]|uniref:hypothetical protein n=1 Tax=Nonomuraea endophytica TaxID=714136 RepID=UPI0037C66004
MALRRTLTAVALAVGLALPVPAASAAGTVGLALAVPAASAAGRTSVPDVGVTVPAEGSVHPAGPLLLSGPANGATQVRVAVQDRASRLWLRPDGSFGDHHAFPARVSGAGWSYTWDQAVPGEFGVQVSVASGGAPPYRSFSVVRMPSASIGAATLAPAADQVLRAGRATTARGLAGAEAGVAAVDVAIKDRTSGLWWRADGSWGALEWQRAHLAEPGAARTMWSLPWTPPRGGDFATQVRTTGVGGGAAPVAEWPFTRFAVDAEPPDAVVESAAGTRWQGRASDAVGVAAVYVAIQDRASRNWWRADGSWGAFQRHPATLTGPPGDEPWTERNGAHAFTATGWTFAWTPPRAGSYGLQVTAVDAAGLADPSLPWLPFESAGGADAERPAVAITAPRADDVLTAGPVRLAGTVTDDVAVARIHVAVMDTATGQWWRPGGGWGGYARLDPQVTGLGTRHATWTLSLPQPPDGTYLTHVEAFDAAGNKAGTGGVLPHVRFGYQQGAQRLATLMFGRSQWQMVDPWCAPLRGSVPLAEVAAAMGGVRATPTVVVARTGDGERSCAKGFADYATWSDLAELRDRYGWQAVSHSQTYPANFAALSGDRQRAESCGTLAAFEARGHTRAWGLFAYPNNKHSLAAQRDVVSTCFSYGRAYGTGVNTRSGTAAPYFQKTWSFNGGRCADPARLCASWVPDGKLKSDPDNVNAYPPYSSPEALAAFLSGGAGQWRALQGYRFLRGKRIAADGTGQWDCTGADWRAHWTNNAESYCLADFLGALGQVRGATFTDPATVAEAWGRGRPAAPGTE